MKKHVIVTIGVLMIFSVLLAGLLIERSRIGEGDAADFPRYEGNTNDSLSGGKKDASDSETMQDTEHVQKMPQMPDTEQVMEKEETDGPITMMFAGDVLFRSYFREHYPSEGIGSVISDGLLDEFVNADLAMVNQEFPFSSRGVPMEGKQYTFRVDPSYVTALNDLGIDIVTLANNHVLDYGKEALEDTFATLDGAGIRYAGAGVSEERAKELQTFEINGKTLGILAASRVIPVVEWNVENEVPGVFATYDGTALCEAIQAAKESCDFVAVYVHWGVEYKEYPEEYQRVLAKQYIDSGADFVVGTHTHCLQGIEYYNGKPVFYGLGNFGFGAGIERTLAIRVVISSDGNVECELIPVKAVNGCTMQMDEAEGQMLYRYMEEISQGIAVDAQGVVSPKE